MKIEKSHQIQRFYKKRNKYKLLIKNCEKSARKSMGMSRFLKVIETLAKVLKRNKKIWFSHLNFFVKKCVKQWIFIIMIFTCIFFKIIFYFSKIQCHFLFKVTIGRRGSLLVKGDSLLCTKSRIWRLASTWLLSKWQCLIFSSNISYQL